MTMANLSMQGFEAAQEKQSVENDAINAKLSIANVDVQKGGKQVTVYNTRTNEPLEINVANVRSALKKKHNDEAYPAWAGKPLFTLGTPNAKGDAYTAPGEYRLPNFMCWLYPGHPDYKTYEDMGFRACTGKHFASPAEAELHMRRGHKDEYRKIMDTREEKRREEDRAFQRAQLEMMGRILAGQQTQAAPMMVATGSTAVAVAPVREVITVKCDLCDETFSSTVKAATQSKLNAHKKKAHSEAN